VAVLQKCSLCTRINIFIVGCLTEILSARPAARAWQLSALRSTMGRHAYVVEAQILDASETLVSKKTIKIEVAEPALLLHQENSYYALTNYF